MKNTWPLENRWYIFKPGWKLKAPKLGITIISLFVVFSVIGGLIYVCKNQPLIVWAGDSGLMTVYHDRPGGNSFIEIQKIKILPFNGSYCYGKGNLKTDKFYGWVDAIITNLGELDSVCFKELDKRYPEIQDQELKKNVLEVLVIPPPAGDFLEEKKACQHAKTLCELGECRPYDGHKKRGFCPV